MTATLSLKNFWKSLSIWIVSDRRGAAGSSCWGGGAALAGFCFARL